jgi:hypothetical protein
VTITCVNDLPTAAVQAVSTPEDTPIVVTLSGSDVETCELTFATGPANNGSLGSITNDPCLPGAPNTDSATVTFTPAANVCSPTDGSFTYTTNDGSTTSPPATVTVTITCVNDVPTATSLTVSTPEDTAIVVTLAGSDVETCELTFVAGAATNGSLSATTDAACVPGAPNTDTAAVTFTPAANVCSPADGSFTYTTNDGSATSPPATVTVTITCVNDIPVADAKVVATNRNAPVIITLSGSDVETCEIIFATANVTNGSLGPVTDAACLPGAPNTDSATVTFTPALDVCTPTQGSFTYTTDDGAATSTSATVTININCPPTADAKAETTTIDTPVVITLSGSDLETCELTFATANVTNGSLSVLTDNPCTSGNPNTDSATITFTPTTGVCSPMQGSFTYTVDDGLVASLPATVTIDITC